MGGSGSQLVVTPTARLGAPNAQYLVQKFKFGGGQVHIHEGFAEMMKLMSILRTLMFHWIFGGSFLNEIDIYMHRGCWFTTNCS